TDESGSILNRAIWRQVLQETLRTLPTALVVAVIAGYVAVRVARGQIKAQSKVTREQIAAQQQATQAQITAQHAATTKQIDAQNEATRRLIEAQSQVTRDGIEAHNRSTRYQVEAQSHITAIRQELQHVTAQLNSFYGPFLAFSKASDELYRQFVKQHGRW